MSHPLAPEAFRMRHGKLVADEREKNPLRWWYLSFAAKAFLGGVFVRAHGMADALEQVSKRGINPGGEVRGAFCTDGTEVPDEYANRLLSKAELQKADAEDAERKRAKDGP